MIIGNEIQHIREHILGILLQVLKTNKRYINTYFVNQKHRIGNVDDDAMFRKLIKVTNPEMGIVTVTDLFIGNKKVVCDGFSIDDGKDFTCAVELFSVDDLYTILKWMQWRGLLDDILKVAYCFSCGSLGIHKLAYVQAHEGNKFVEYYDKEDNEIWCTKCQKYTRIAYFNHVDAPDKLVDNWFASASIPLLEDITRLNAKTDFPKDKENKAFLAKCKQAWNVLDVDRKRQIWAQYRDI